MRREGRTEQRETRREQEMLRDRERERLRKLEIVERKK